MIGVISPILFQKSEIGKLEVLVDKIGKERKVPTEIYNVLVLCLREPLNRLLGVGESARGGNLNFF